MLFRLFTLHVVIFSQLSFLSVVRSSDEDVSNENRRLGNEVTKILDNIRINYDKRVRPNYGGAPVVVGVTMYVLSISSLSEVDMDFTVDFYFRQTWKDPRLIFKGPPGVKTISVGTEFLRTLWVPDTFFVNEKKSYFHTATTNNEFLRITEEGDVLRSFRLTVTASCYMSFQYFPMDTNLCALEIESYGHTMADIRYMWAKGVGSIGLSSDVSLPEFRVLGHRSRDMQFHFPSGNYSRLACEIQFVRSWGYYLWQIYIPSAIVVILSWVSFWLNRNDSTIRVGLGVITVLTITNLMSSTNAGLPKISYATLADVYLRTCFVMVFASLLEYATIGYMAKRIQMNKDKLLALKNMEEQKKAVMDHHDEHGAKQIEEKPVDSLLPPGKNVDKLYGITPSDLDKCSRVIFPVGFICFNLMYWIYYLHVSAVEGGDFILLH